MARPRLPRLLPALALGLTLTAVASGPAAALPPADGSAAAPPTLQHPTPRLVPIPLDYTAPLTFEGAVVALAPPGHAVVHAALVDFSYLVYRHGSDLGGFAGAPIGRYLELTTGHAVRKRLRSPQMPLLTRVGKRVFVFGYGAPGTVPATPTIVPPRPAVPPPPAGKTPRTAFVTPPRTTSQRVVPPTALQRVVPPPRPVTTLPTTPAPAPSSTTTTTTTTTTAAPGPVASPTTPPVEYIELTETHGHFPLIDVTNMEPGEYATEVLTLENIGTAPFELSIQSVPTTTTTLSSQLQLVVTGTGADARTYYRGRVSSNGVQDIAELAPRTSIRLLVALTLPLSAGNDVQDRTAKVNLYWDATQGG